MKKRYVLILCSILVLSLLVACGNNVNEETQNLEAEIEVQDIDIAEEVTVSEDIIDETAVSDNSVSEDIALEDMIDEEAMLEPEYIPTLTVEEIDEMDKSGLSAEELLSLYLQCDRDELTFISLDKHHVNNVTNIINMLSYFPNLEQVDMCDCGLTNEQYDSINRYFPDTKVVWRIYMGHWSLRTDAVAFGTFQGKVITYQLNNQDAAQFKYCTDMVAIDIGHNRVSDVSWLQYMPNLKICILVDNRPLSDISYLKYCPKLEYLEFFVDSVSDLSVFQELPNLKDVNIGYNPIRDITYLRGMPNLEKLWIECVQIPYSDYQLLCEEYPNAKIVYYGEGSIDQGWREGERYWAMRKMLMYNIVDPVFMDPDEREAYEAQLAAEEAAKAAEEEAARAAAEAEAEEE